MYNSLSAETTAKQNIKACVLLRFHPSVLYPQSSFCKGEIAVRVASTRILAIAASTGPYCEYFMLKIFWKYFLLKTYLSRFLLFIYLRFCCECFISETEKSEWYLLACALPRFCSHIVELKARERLFFLLWLDLIHFTFIRCHWSCFTQKLRRKLLPLGKSYGRVHFNSDIL